MFRGYLEAGNRRACLSYKAKTRYGGTLAGHHKDTHVHVPALSFSIEITLIRQILHYMNIIPRPPPAAWVSSNYTNANYLSVNYPAKNQKALRSQ